MSAYKCRALGRQVAIVLASILPFAASGEAQSATSADVQRQVDEAFKAVVNHVDSNEARLKYARLLVEAGNFEGGIATLEGMLLVPDAPASIRVELAVLYYRLGSYGIAQAYLQEALADPRLDSDLRSQAKRMLVDVAKRNKISSISGSLMLGVRGQSNPTAAASDDQILSRGVLVSREQQARPNSDADVQVLGTLDHVYDLGAQNEASIVTSLVGLIDHYASVDSYSSHPGSTKPFDMTAIAGSTGIRFKPAPGSAQDFTLRPYLIYGDVLLNGGQYFSTAGFGLDGNYRVSDRLSWGGALEHRHFSFADRADITNSTLPSGDENTARVRGIVEVSSNKVLMGEVGYVNRNAQRDDFEFNGPEAKAALVLTYLDPVANTGYNWTTTIVGSVLQRRYRGADVEVDPTKSRRDTEQRISLLNVMPFARDISLRVQLEYTDSRSNIPNYQYTNAAASVGVLWNY